jgi:hypothetical protein
MEYNSFPKSLYGNFTDYLINRYFLSQPSFYNKNINLKQLGSKIYGILVDFARKYNGGEFSKIRPNFTPYRLTIMDYNLELLHSTVTLNIVRLFNEVFCGDPNFLGECFKGQEEIEDQLHNSIEEFFIKNLGISEKSIYNIYPEYIQYLE